MMSDINRGPLGHDDPNRGPLDRTANALDGRDDPTRGPLDRTANAMDGHDDPNRGPLDRAANMVTGGSGGVSGAMARDDDGRGPIDRTLDGHDDPSRGPLDRAANAVTGGSGGVSTALDRNAGHGDEGRYAATGAATSRTGVVSALFDSETEAQRAVAELRTAGVPDAGLSLLAQERDGTVTRGGDGTVVHEEHGSFLRGILGGGALGAGLGVAALAIPGVGPLVGLGAIAASAVPSAMAAGAAFGAAAGTWNEMLAKHGIDEEDAAYYHRGMGNGGILLAVDAAGVDAERVRDILFRHGGHSASQARTAAL